MNDPQSLNLLDGISMITKKQRQFIKQTLMETDKTLNELRDKGSDSQSKARTFTKSQPKKYSLQKIQLNAIDKHYTFLLKCIQIKLNHPYSIFLQPHNQEYFSFDMGIHVFPLILQIHKISAQGILFIGFNEQYPGLQKTSRTKDSLSQKKIQINKTQSIEIQRPGNRNIHHIYFLFTSSKKCLSLNFLLTSSSTESPIKFAPKTKKNFFDIIDQKLKAPLKKFRVKTEIAPRFSMTKASYLQKLEKISNDQHFSTFTTKFTALSDKKFQNQDISDLKKITKSIIFNQSISMKSLTTVNFGLNKTLSNTQFKNESINSFLRTHVNFSTEEKQQISQKNLQQLQLYKEKTDKLQSLVQKFKGEIQQMKKQHDQNQIKKKKILKSITTMIKLSKFASISQKAFVKRKNTLSRFLKTIVNVNKFIHKLKNHKKSSQRLVPQANSRIVYGLLPFTRFLSAITWQRADDTAQKAISKSFNKLFPCFLYRQLIEKSEIYLQKVIKVQTMYRERLKAQRRILEIYCLKIVENLVLKFPNFMKFVNNFKDQKVYEKLISIYIKDENLKFNSRVTIYKKQLKQREEFIEMNFNLMNKNIMQSLSKFKGKSPMKRKAKMEKNQLQIPSFPVKPCKSLFRNLNILQMMIRNWFELENFMWKKKEKAKKEWL